MPDEYIQLEDANLSGDLTDIKLGGTGANKSVATKEYVNSPLSTRDFEAQGSPPSFLRGRTFYETEHEGLSVYTDVEGVTHNLGQEHLIRVKNVSGSVITNSSVCKLSGSDPLTGFPIAELAQANSFENAIILGIATHDILHGSFGWLTQIGIIHDIDTSDFSVNDIVYLDRDTPGAITTTKTNITSRVGQILKSDASEGSLLVFMQSALSLPPIFGLLQGQVNTYNLTSTYQNIVNYTSKEEINISLNNLLGQITAPNSGKYRITVNASMTVPSAVTTRNVNLQVWDLTSSGQIGNYAIPISRDTTVVSRSFSIPISLQVGHIYVCRINSDVSISGVTFQSFYFDVESINVS